MANDLSKSYDHPLVLRLWIPIEIAAHALFSLRKRSNSVWERAESMIAPISRATNRRNEAETPALANISLLEPQSTSRT